MKKIILTLFALILSTSCHAEVPASQVAEWKKQYSQGNVVGLDVRTAVELKINPSPGAQHQSYLNLTPFIEKGDKSKTIYVFCESGGRSAKAKTKLEKAGFKNVVNITDWRTWNKITSKK